MPGHCASAAHAWWVALKAKAAQQPRKKQYIGKPGDMRMADLARQLDLSPSYTGQLVKKGMPATSKEAAQAWRATNVRALSADDDLYVTTTHLSFVCSETDRYQVLE
jgi:methylphosphotriester-DNA--protein-cysteine methyltransferase